MAPPENRKTEIRQVPACKRLWIGTGKHQDRQKQGGARPGQEHVRRNLVQEVTLRITKIRIRPRCRVTLFWTYDEEDGKGEGILRRAESQVLLHPTDYRLGRNQNRTTFVAIHSLYLWHSKKSRINQPVITRGKIGTYTDVGSVQIVEHCERSKGWRSRLRIGKE